MPLTRQEIPLEKKVLMLAAELRSKVNPESDSLCGLWAHARRILLESTSTAKPNPGQQYC